MARNGVDQTGSDFAQWDFRPWIGVAASAAVAVVALGASFLDPEWLHPIRGLLLFGSMLTAISSVSYRLRTAAWDFDERMISAGVVLAASFVTLINFFGLDAAWDTIRLLLGVIAAVGFLGAGILLLPSLGRRIVLSLLIVFHFGGILTTVTCVGMGGGSPPWVSLQLWTRFYRPYLQFVYLNNAYHFYSPQPGPACLAWFFVTFDDGSGEWWRLPTREEFSTRQEYQRMLALTEQLNSYDPPNITEADLVKKLEARKYAGNFTDPRIPWYDYPAINIQYHEPNTFARDMISANARHVARTYKSKRDPDLKVKTVKVYRVIHDIMAWRDMSLEDFEHNPNFPTLFKPYFEGEFDTDGKLVNPNDPFLHWMLPYGFQAKNKLTDKTIDLFGKPARVKLEDLEVVDFCDVHARSTLGK